MRGLFVRLIAFAVFVGAAEAGDGPACQPGSAEPVVVARAENGATLRTTDGRGIRLAGVLLPSAVEAGATAGAWPLEQAAAKFLSEIVVGKKVIVTPAAGKDGTDRHGRTVGDVHLVEPTGARWVQGALIDAGLAVALPEPASARCHAVALEAETRARAADTGVSGSNVWRLIDLDREPLRPEMASTFRIVRGVVRRTWRQRTGVVVLVEGRTRGAGIEVVLDAAAMRGVESGGEGAQRLAGRAVEVRGWLEVAANTRSFSRSRGPWRFMVRTDAAGGLRVFESGTAPAAQGAAKALPLIETGIAATK